MGKLETMADFIFLGSKITADGDCSHEIKRCLLLGRKVMTNPVQFSSVTQVCLTLCDPRNCSMPRPPCPSPNSRVPKLMSIVSWMSSNHPIPYHPLLLLPSIFPSIRVFSNESALSIRWPVYWSFSFNISPSNEYSGLISLRIDWLDLLADSAQESLEK